MFDALIDRLTARLYGPVELLFRVALSLIFLIGGLGHFMRAEDMLTRIVDSPWHDFVLALGSPLLFLHLSGAVFIIAGLLLIVGYSTRLAALALFVTLVPITFVIHIAPGHEGPLFKNVAILGALLFIAVRGSYRLSIDGRLRAPGFTASI
ncbi:DoxX family protein [Pararhodobacter sp. CCB-MM2]|uniref:DoxX family protein n=1 Tax=Pararhodobacter sp. CCB-MM2 TaxID=1786003 RepID=UPI000832937F|nr:DoxX family protein [Pararhodobacter sp. CCB-MM2]